MSVKSRHLLAPVMALAFAFGAQAFSPQLEGFEGYAADDGITSGANNFRYEADEGVTDASVVAAYGEDAKPTDRSPKFADDGDNYLKLSTDEGILFRDVKANGAAANLGAAGIDVDAVIQFTVTDKSDRPTLGGGDKLAIWLEADDSAGTTNLMVYGGLYTVSEGALSRLRGSAFYKLNLRGEIEPGSWHRVTIKALPNVNAGGLAIPGFQILIDDTAAVVERVLDDGETGSLIFDATGAAAYANDNSIISAGLADGTYVPSLSDATTISAVGFSGNGKVDDIAIIDNSTDGVMLELVDGVESTDDGGVYTFTAPTGYTIGSIATNGVVIAIAPGQTAVNFEPAAGTTSLIVSATKTRPAPVHKWFELPSAIASTRLYDAQAKVSGFKGSRDDEFYTFNYKTSNGGYKLYDYDSLRSGDATPVSELTAATAKAEIPGYAASDATRGAAVCKALNVNFIMSYVAGDKMLSIPLTSTNAVADASVIENDRGYAFDSGAFSPDGQYLFTNVLPDKNSGVTNTMVVKWQVLNGLKGNGTNLLYMSQLNVGDNAGSRIRHAEYVRIGGKDLVYCLVDDIADGSAALNAGIKVANMTDGTVATICALTGKASYGMFAISGVASGTPHLTFGPSQNNGYDASTNPWAGEGQKILVYTLAADGLSVVGDPLEFTLPDMGIPSQEGYGNTLLVSDDEKTMFYVCSDGLIYAVEYAVARVEGGFGYETLKEAVEAASEGDTVKVLADCTVTEAITFTAGINLTNDYTVSLAADYALRLANGTTTPVTVSGTGTITWSSGSGSPFLVGNNEQENSTKMGYGITNTCSGSLVLNSGTFGSTTGSGNMVKVENGSFTMNGGSIDAACTRCVKADADAGAFTATVTINGGTIRNSKASAPVALCSSAESADGTASVTVNGGDITGTLVYGKTAGTYELTIPGTSTARFDRDQTAFCVAGYETTQSGDWYVVTQKPQFRIVFLHGEGSSTYQQMYERDLVPEPPTPALVEGKVFDHWEPTIEPVVSNTAYWARYVPGVASVDGVAYLTFAEAVAAIATGTTTDDYVTLLTNVSTTVVAGETLKVKKNGHSLTVTKASDDVALTLSVADGITTYTATVGAAAYSPNGQSWTWYASFDDAYAAAVAGSGNALLKVRLTSDFTPTISTTYDHFYSLTFEDVRDDQSEGLTINLKNAAGTAYMESSRYFFPANATLVLAADWEPWTTGLATGGTLAIPEGVTVFVDCAANGEGWKYLNGLAGVSGAGTIKIGDHTNVDGHTDAYYILGNPDTGLAKLLQAAAWQGTLELTGGCDCDFELAKVGNANSKVRFNGFTTMLHGSGHGTVGVELVGDGLSITGAYDSARTYTIGGAISGSGALTLADNTGSLLLAGDVSGFTGDVTASGTSSAITFGSATTGSGQRIVVDGGSSVTNAADATWTAANVIVAGELVANGTMSATTLGGNAGTGVYRANNSAAAITAAGSWNGTYVIGWSPSGAFNPNSYGNASSTVALAADLATGAYFGTESEAPLVIEPTVRLDADVEIKHGYSESDDSALVTFTTLTGDHALTTRQGYSSTQAMRYAITMLDAFSGALNVSANSSLNIGTVNIAREPSEGQRIVEMTLGTGATVGGNLNLAVSGTASGTLEYKANGSEGAGLYVAGAPTPTVPEVTPSTNSTINCGSAAAATAAAAAINEAKTTYIKAPEGLSGEAVAAYANLFDARADGDNVVVELNAAGTNALETVATNLAAQIVAPANLASILSGTRSLSLIGAQPGFFYSVVYATNLTALATATEGGREMADAAGEVALPMPATEVGATAGFYRVLVNVQPKVTE